VERSRQYVECVAYSIKSGPSAVWKIRKAYRILEENHLKTVTRQTKKEMGEYY
jgi:hypothetical protein